MPFKNSMALETLAERIVRRYGFEPARLLEVQKGYRNESHPVQLRDGIILNLMLYKHEPGIIQTIKNANRVSNFLAVRDFPARRTVDSRIIRLQSAPHRKYAALYTYLPGQTIAWESYTQNHIKLLGKAMSDMHAALQRFDAGDLPDVVDQYVGIVGRMRRYFSQPGVRLALEVKLKLKISQQAINRYSLLLELCRQLTDKQVLHMDFVRSNILFAETNDDLRISGILDFEKTAFGHPVFDIARTLSFLLVDCKYKLPIKVRKYFLYSGYQKRGTAKLEIPIVSVEGENVNILKSLLDLFLIYDIYKFLRHNPYESLPSNVHFIRTKNILIGRGIVTELA